MPGGLHPPPEVQAHWPVPNYEHPVTHGRGVLIVACVLGPLSLAVIFARLWVRFRIQRNAGIDDWIMVLAVIPLIATTVLICFATEIISVDRHTWDVYPLLFPIQRKNQLALETLFCFVSALIKISVLLFYRRLSQRTVSRAFYWIAWFTIGFVIVYTMGFILFSILSCQPLSDYWEQADVIKIAEGYKYNCLDEGFSILIAGIISAVQDFAATLLPTLLYWNLKLPARQKIALFGCFSIGCGVALCGAVRTYYSWVMYFGDYDSTWHAWSGLLWLLLELQLGTICANGPTLRLLFSHYFPSEKSTSQPKFSSRAELIAVRKGRIIRCNTDCICGNDSFDSEMGHVERG